MEEGEWTVNEIRLYEVGGCVRDELLGVPSKDVDFAVEAESFDSMVDFIVAEGHRIVDERPEFLTVRAVVGKNHPLRERTNAADFVLCRKDGEYVDGRRPESVSPGTILDDLDRRDFTMNAIARDLSSGELIDPHGGLVDLGNRTIRFVGEPTDRIAEDGLRVIRALRFMVTKGFVLDRRTDLAVRTPLAFRKLKGVSIERVRDELDKMVRFDSIRSLEVLSNHPRLLRAIFRDGLRFEATLKKA